MKTKLLITLTALLLTRLFSYSQGTFNTLLFEYPNAISYDIIELKDSSYLLTGSIDVTNDMDLFLCKIKKNGSIDWSKRIGNSQNSECGMSTLALDNNELIIAGTSWNYTDQFSLYVVKLNQYSDTLWTKKFKGCSPDGKIISNNENGYVISGYTVRETGGDTNFSDVYILNLNSDGDTIWTRKFVGTKSSDSFDIINTSDSCYLMTGFTESTSTKSNIYILKIDKHGNLIWSKTYSSTYGNNYNNEASSAVETKDKGFIIAGTTHNIKNDGNESPYILKLNEFGDTLWTKTLNGYLTRGGCVGIVQTYDSGFIITGTTGEFPNTNIQLIKMNQSGNIIWTTKIKGYNYDGARSLIQTMDSSIVIVGNSNIDSNIFTHLIRVDKNGELKIKAIDDTLDIFENLPKETIIGKVNGLIGGNTLGNFTNGYKLEYTNLDSAVFIQPNNGNISVLDSSLIDYETIQSFDLFVKVTDGVNFDLSHILVKIKDVYENYSMIQNPKTDLFNIYPNPSSGLVQINSESKSEKLTIKLFDINGKTINKQIVEGKDKIIINYTKYPKGLYYLKISTDQDSFSKTLILK